MSNKPNYTNKNNQQEEGKIDQIGGKLLLPAASATEDLGVK